MSVVHLLRPRQMGNDRHARRCKLVSDPPCSRFLRTPRHARTRACRTRREPGGSGSCREPCVGIAGTDTLHSLGATFIHRVGEREPIVRRRSSAVADVDAGQPPFRAGEILFCRLDNPSDIQSARAPVVTRKQYACPVPLFPRNVIMISKFQFNRGHAELRKMKGSIAQYRRDLRTLCRSAKNEITCTIKF